MPKLFNVFPEELFKEYLLDVNEGIRVSGRTINIAGRQFGESYQRYGMKINTNKTKVMVISKNSNASEII